MLDKPLNEENCKVADRKFTSLRAQSGIVNATLDAVKSKSSRVSLSTVWRAREHFRDKASQDITGQGEYLNHNCQSSSQNQSFGSVLSRISTSTAQAQIQAQEITCTNSISESNRQVLDPKSIT